MTDLRLVRTPIQRVNPSPKSHFGPVGTSGDPSDAPTGPGMLAGALLTSGDVRESTPGAQLDYFAVFQSNLSARRANPFLATNCAQYCTGLPKAWISVQNHTLEPWGHQGAAATLPPAQECCQGHPWPLGTSESRCRAAQLAFFRSFLAPDLVLEGKIQNAKSVHLTETVQKLLFDQK